MNLNIASKRAPGTGSMAGMVVTVNGLLSGPTLTEFVNLVVYQCGAGASGQHWRSPAGARRRGQPDEGSGPLRRRALGRPGGRMGCTLIPGACMKDVSTQAHAGQRPQCGVRQ